MIIINPKQDSDNIYFSLTPGERIFVYAKPEKGRYISEYIILSLIHTIIAFIFFGLPMALTVIAALLIILLGPKAFSFGLAILISFILFFSLIFLVNILLANFSYNRHGYWITNKRIVLQSGRIGFHVDSIPIEYIQDITINYSFTDLIFHTASLYVTLGTFYGQFGGPRYGSYLGNVVKIRWLPPNDAKKLQSILFQLRNMVLQQNYPGNLAKF